MRAELAGLAESAEFAGLAGLAEFAGLAGLAESAELVHTSAGMDESVVQTYRASTAEQSWYGVKREQDQ